MNLVPYWAVVSTGTLSTGTLWLNPKSNAFMSKISKNVPKTPKTTKKIQSDVSRLSIRQDIFNAQPLLGTFKLCDQVG